MKKSAREMRQAEQGEGKGHERTVGKTAPGVGDRTGREGDRQGGIQDETGFWLDL